jgi:hypothetical protein
MKPSFSGRSHEAHELELELESELELELELELSSEDVFYIDMEFWLSQLLSGE